MGLRTKHIGFSNQLSERFLQGAVVTSVNLL